VIWCIESHSINSTVCGWTFAHRNTSTINIYYRHVWLWISMTWHGTVTNMLGLWADLVNNVFCLLFKHKGLCVVILFVLLPSWSFYSRLPTPFAAPYSSYFPHTLLLSLSSYAVFLSFLVPLVILYAVLLLSLCRFLWSNPLHLSWFLSCDNAVFRSCCRISKQFRTSIAYFPIVCFVVQLTSEWPFYCATLIVCYICSV